MKNRQQEIDKANQILSNLNLTPITEPEKHFDDVTVKSYFSIVKDQNRQDFFIKINTREDNIDNNRFYKASIIGNLINGKNITLSKFTPKLIKSSIEAGNCYLMYQSVNGNNMGSRKKYDYTIFNTKHKDNFLKITDSITRFNINLLPSDFDKFNINNYLQEIFNLNKISQPYLEKNEKYNQIHKLFVQLCNITNALKENLNNDFLIHGDYQSVNFILTSDDYIYINDFELSMIGDRFYDLAYFITHLITKPHVQQFYYQLLIDKYVNNDKNRITFHQLLLLMSFMQVLALTKSVYIDFERFSPDEINFRKQMIEARIDETIKYIYLLI